MYPTVYAEFVSVVQRASNTSLPDWVRFEPFDNATDLMLFDRMIHWLWGLPLVFLWGLSALNGFVLCPRNTALQSGGRGCQRVLLYMQTFVLVIMGIVLLAVLYLRHGAGFGSHMAQNMQAIGWSVIAVSMIAIAVASSAYSFRASSKTESMRSSIAFCYGIMGLELIVTAPLYWSNALLQNFAGVLLMLGAAAGSQTHYLHGATVGRSTADLVGERFMYAMYTIAAGLVSGINSWVAVPYEWLLRDKYASPWWPVSILFFTLLVLAICAKLLWLCIHPYVPAFGYPSGSGGGKQQGGKGRRRDTTSDVELEGLLQTGVSSRPSDSLRPARVDDDD